MKNKIKSILLTSLAILSLWGMTYTTKQLHALTALELKSYMNEYKAGNYGENQIFLSADGNFVIYTKARPHTSGTVHTFFGYEISKLQNKDGKVVNPFNAEYSAYNASMVAKGTTSSDPHFYNGSNRISFVINRFLQSPAGVRDSSTAWVSESTDSGDNITVISRALIKNGIMQSHDQEWIDQWNAWDHIDDIVKIAKDTRDAHSKDADTGDATTPVDDILDSFEKLKTADNVTQAQAGRRKNNPKTTQI